MAYWTSPRGILRRARDKANPYERPAAVAAFNEGWRDAASADALVGGRNAYAVGWNARCEYERNQQTEVT